MLVTLYPVVPCRTRGRHPLAFSEAGPAEPAKPRLFDRVRAAARLRHYRRTEAAYIASPNDVSTTMIHTYVLNQVPAGVTSPADRVFDP